MDNGGLVTLLGRRLDRLRTDAPVPSVRPGPGGGVRVGDLGWEDHATPLAEAVGGQVVRTELGLVVALKSTVDVRIDTGRLATLPYPIAEGHPLICLDLETTGLATASGTLAFLVGIGIWLDGRLTVHQLLLPDHSGERALLEVLSGLLPADGWLVTYNGKCFDWPLLTARYRLHRRDPPPYAGHLDLLPVARQLWKHRVGGARLALIEQALCGVERVDDLPGYLIPDRYFNYLRTRRGSLLQQIVAHNRQDIVSLAGLLAVLADELAVPSRWAQAHPGDLFGLARGYARRGRPAEALAVVEAALAADAWSIGLPAGAQLHRRLSAEHARLLARLGRREEAFAAWLVIARRGGPGAGLAWLHVARYREHVLRNVTAALEASQQAATIAERAREWGSPLSAIELDLARRLPRLRRLLFRRRALSGDVGRAA
jgi:uncharacterized protein